MLVHFDMTEEDIDNGIASDCAKCPLSLCITRILNRKTFVGYAIAFDDLGEGPAMQCPPLLRDFFKAFDDWKDSLTFASISDLGLTKQHKRPQPISFDLDVPEPF